MAIFNFNDLSKQAKIGYNALYNVILTNLNSFDSEGLKKFTVPLCLDSNNKVSLTERNFIFFESILSELKLEGFYNLVKNNGRAVEDSKTDFFTVEITISKNIIEVPDGLKQFSFTDVDTSKLLKRDGKAEKSKTVENKEKKVEEQKTAEKTSKELEEKTAEVETLKKVVAQKNEQLNKKQIDKFNDEALFSIADCVEFLVKKHCPIPAEFDFKTFETDLFKVISAHWDLKVLDK